MIKAMIAIFTLMFSISGFSANLESFNKRFTVSTSGDDVIVKMNLYSNKFSAIPYLKQVKHNLLEQILFLRNKENNAIDNLVTDMRNSSTKSVESEESINSLETSLREIDAQEINKVFSSEMTVEVLSYFEDEINKSFSKMSLATIANTSDTKYFYKRNVAHAVVKKVLDYAKSKIGNVPMLNAVSFMIVEVYDMLIEQRTIHQNMLLFYLNNVNESQLGLSVNQVNKLFSSIYESRINYLNYKESERASQNWQSYGLDKFYLMMRTANNKLRRSRGLFDSTPVRVNFGFVSVEQDGNRFIKNLIHNKHQYSTEMSIAYNYNNADKVKRFRSLLSLGKLGLSFLTIPSWLKEQAVTFIDSYYVEQRKLEGALLGYFEYSGDTLMSKNVKSQILNPYLR